MNTIDSFLAVLPAGFDEELRVAIKELMEEAQQDFGFDAALYFAMVTILFALLASTDRTAAFMCLDSLQYNFTRDGIEEEYKKRLN